MATHRPQDRGFSPELAFQLTLDVLDAIEDLTVRHRPATPKTLTPLLRARALRRDRAVARVADSGPEPRAGP